jgi:SAM-dependent methyltransferase
MPRNASLEATAPRTAERAIDFSKRAELTELMDEPCGREDLRSCLRDLERLNRWFLGYRPVLRWLDSLDLRRAGRPLHVLDVGCGFGDGLRRIERWARQSGVEVELTGCDINPDAAAIAADATPKTSQIEWIAADIFSYDSRKPIDIVISSLFTHHLKEDEIVRFLRWMEATTHVGWFINDLSRAPAPYRLLKVFSRVAGLHPFVQHDGPVSIARAFVADDWRRMCAAADLHECDVTIESFTPARLCVGRKKKL